jgi:hypothetical protein
MGNCTTVYICQEESPPITAATKGECKLLLTPARNMAARGTRKKLARRRALMICQGKYYSWRPYQPKNACSISGPEHELDDPE